MISQLFVLTGSIVDNDYDRPNVTFDLSDHDLGPVLRDLDLVPNRDLDLVSHDLDLQVEDANMASEQQRSALIQLEKKQKKFDQQLAEERAVAER